MRLALLALLLAAPLGLAAGGPLAEATVGGAGWSRIEVDAPPGWRIHVETNATYHGSLVVNGFFLLDASHRTTYQHWFTFPIHGDGETRLRSSGIDVGFPSEDRPATGTFRTEFTLSCAGCDARRMHVVLVTGGDVLATTWRVWADGASLRSSDADEGALALRQRGMNATLDAKQGLVQPEAQVLVDGVARLDAARTLVGVFAEEPGVPGLLRTRGPGGASWTCPCSFPRDTAGPGAYSFHATQADGSSDLVLLVADVRLPQT